MVYGLTRSLSCVSILWALGSLFAVPPAGACGASAGSAEGLARWADRPIGLQRDIGWIHQEVTTVSPEAQAYYDQGLSYLSSYSWISAARSFEEALRRDSRLAMAHLGLARAFWNLQAFDRARQHLDMASRLGDTSAVEKAWIRLGTVRLEAGLAAPEARRALLEAYREAVGALVSLDSGSPHTWVLGGIATEPDALGRGQAGGRDAISFFLRALRLDEDFFPAHHFLAHTYENLGDLESAVLHARRYLELAPGAPHAHHMLGHMLPGVGLWEEARQRFLAADRLHRQSAEGDGVSPGADWHFAHNRRFLALVELRAGSSERAEEISEGLPGLPGLGWRAAIYCASQVELLLVLDRPREALPTASQCLRRRDSGAAPIAGSLAAEAHLRLGHLGEAQAVLEEAKAALGLLIGEARSGPRHLRRLTFNAREIVALVEAQLALARGLPGSGDRLLQMAHRWIRQPGFDTWGENLILRLPRVATLARALDKEELALRIETMPAQRASPPRPGEALEGESPVGASLGSVVLRCRPP